MTAQLTAKRCRYCGWTCIEVVMPLECPVCRAAGCNKGTLVTIKSQADIKPYLMCDYLEKHAQTGLTREINVYDV
ncbi:MAG: hypothetical protein U0822_05620 [Anaerolineae bacterium]